MKLFHDRPLAAVAAIFTLVSVAAVYIGGALKIAFFAFALFVAASVFLISKVHIPRVSVLLGARRAIIISSAAAAALACAISYAFFNVVYESWRARDGDEVRISATVTDKLYENGYSGRYIVRLSEIDGTDARSKLILEASFAPGLSVGDTIEADGTIEALDSGGSFDEEAYYLPRGVFGVLVVSEPASLDVTGEDNGVMLSISRLRRRIAAMTEVAMEEAGGDFGIAEALLIGERDALDESVSRDFRYVGASHLLAVSGLHLTIVIGSISILLRKLTIPRRPRAAATIALTLFYMAITGFSASVVRAGIMAVIAEGSNFARRQGDPVTSLFAASALMMAFSPASAADTGLLLSISAMAGCFSYSEMSKRRSRPRSVLMRAVRAAIALFSISVATLLFTTPVMWLTLGRVSLLSPVASVIMTAPVTLVLYLCPLAAIFFRIPVLRRPISYVCALLCRFAASEARLLSRVDGAVIDLDGAFAAVAVAAIAALLIAAVVCSGKRSAAAAAMSLCVFAALAVSGAIYNASAKSCVYYVNSGKNDAFAVADGGAIVICDVSDGSWSAVSSAVDAVGGSRIDALLLTHLHNRHVRTVGKLCRREYVDAIYAPAPENDAERAVFASIENAASALGVPVVEYDRGDRLEFADSAVVDTIPRTSISRSTHPVLALVFDVGDHKTVYIGSSCGESSVSGYVSDACADADAVIFGAHGPICKRPFDFSIPDRAAVVFVDSAIAELMIDENSIRRFDMCSGTVRRIK